MAIACGRFFRFLRAIFAPAATIIGFGLLLTWIFVLYQPIVGPGELQRLGWQAWEPVSDTKLASGTGSSAEEQSSVPGSDVPSNNDGVDWWNVSTQSTEPDTASLPLDVWSPLLNHVTGLTEITVAKCMLPQALSYLCVPDSTPEADAIKGKWVRVERDLNRMSGFWSLYIYYRRSRRLDVDLVNDIVLLPKGEEPTTQDNWRKVDVSVRDGVPRAPPLFLWYKLGPRMSYLSTEEKSNLITELDVLFGDDRPWYGFEKLDPPTTEGREGHLDTAWLTYRRGVKRPPRAPPLHFSRDGKFKILQIADLHFSVSQGKCRDVSFSPCTHSDNLTHTLLGHVLDEEKPDMVVFTGDQLNGQGTSWDPRSVLAKFANAVTDRKIPWAAVFGNHDSENGMNREDQMALLQGMPYSVTQRGPKDVHGVGNYVLKAYSADSSKMHLLTMYFLDSGSYSAGVWDWFGFFHPTEYDYIRENQISWFLQESASIKPIERPFTPDGASDFGDIWERQSASQVTPGTKKLAKPNALMFFHIPLPESYSTPDVDSNTGIPLDIGIHDIEDPGNAKKNDGFFDKGILQALETDHSAGGNVKEVKVIGNGHCHVTENCRRIRGVWLCFAGGGSYSGYSKIGFDRRFRIYDISDYGETIRTYKRTEKDEILDEMTLVGKDAASPYEGTT
ncbi:Metallo-dependent phosphatase [Fomitiporia mediterranea MF3/22]|uniref:Metallo-dependent phosphatase n=1 Tax=Fomitiporia mediterranea (strain MF3/22) TaxID=694068 RepID=UPI00044080A6|nr:Metallo-dependent phosphatase [Fomitiporia mediterranea MF3/22]EJD07471.1 Metallo-dependent phosphatase [Fomitiporia mediterranea MF3/22]